jgi:phosphatidylserine decarboxylase
MRQPKWYPLESKRPGKKTGIVTGAVQLQFSVIDPYNQAASESDVIQRLLTLLGTSNSDLAEEDLSQGHDDEESEPLEPSQSTDQDVSAETSEKRKKRRLRIARLKKSVKERGYEFTNGSQIAGILFVEIQRITDLPPERNGTINSISRIDRLLTLS